MEYLVPLWKHQLEAVERAAPLSEFALFLEPGTGKSATAISILRQKYNSEKRLLRTLILCPPIVIENWRREWGMHSKVPAERILLLSGSGKRREDDFRKRVLEGGSNQSTIAITNYESLLMPPLFGALKRWAPEVLVLDESHKCKEISAKRTKRAIELADTARYKYLLSGSPVLNSLMDIFSQYRILDGGETFGKNFYIFRAEYFWDKNAAFKGRQSYFPDWQVKPGSVEKVNQLIYRKAMRVLKSECMDLPPLVKKTIYCDMSPPQAKAYQEMKKDFVTYLGDQACVAELAITKALRLLQIASGYMKLENGQEAKFENQPKQQALHELLEELTPQHKVIIWAVFKENYAQIRAVCDKLRLHAVEVHGEISQRNKEAAVDSFNRDPQCRVFIGHPLSGGIGINLVEASYCIFYSRNFSLEQDIQAEARNYRGGSEIHEKVTRIDLVAKDTIDEFVVERLQSKQSLSLAVLKDWRDRL